MGTHEEIDRPTTRPTTLSLVVKPSLEQICQYGGILTETDFAELYFAMGWDSVGGG